MTLEEIKKTVEYPVVLSTHDDQVALIENSGALVNCLRIEFQTDVNDLKLRWNAEDRCGSGTFEDDYGETNVFEIHYLKTYS